MQTERVALDQLREDPENERDHPPENHVAIVASLKRFGQVEPLVAREDGTLIGGHGRVRAMREMGWIDAAVVRFAGTEDEARALRIALNRTSELATWKPVELRESLAQLMEKGFDLASIGFTLNDFKRIPVVPHLRNVLGDEVVPATRPDAVSVRGAVYVCGPHRIMCGDSADANDVSILMADRRARVAFTSPPYNVGNNTVGGNKSMIASKYVGIEDRASEGDYVSLLVGTTCNAMAVAEIAVVNIQILSENRIAVIEWLHAMRNHLVDNLVWNKTFGPPAMASNVVNVGHEFLFIFSSRDRPPRSVPTGAFHGTVQSVYTASRGERNDFADVHAATFPKHLPTHVVTALDGDRKGAVLDLFGGTGTAMIACAEMGRPSFTMEIEPVYVDLIRRRWTAWAKEANVDPGSGALE